MRSYPRNMAGLIVIVLCAFMAVNLWEGSRVIAWVLVGIGAFRLGVLVRDLRLRHRTSDPPPDRAPPSSE